MPLNIVDRTKLMHAGSGENVGWLTRAAAATQGEARAIAGQSLLERQLGQGQRLSEAITRYIGTPDFEGRSAQLAREVATRNEALYAAAHQADDAMIAQGRPLGVTLQPFLDGEALRWVYSRGPVGSALRDAINAFRPNVTGEAQQPISTLRQFMQAKQELHALIDANVGNRTVMRELMRFRDDLYGVVEAHNPAWRIANDAAADGFAAQRALDLGMQYGGRLGRLTREQLARFRAMSEPERDLYRIGVAQSLNDRIFNRQATHDLTSELRLPGARQALRTILGDDVATNFFRRIDREFATTRTYQEQFGSRTTPLREAIDDLNWAPRFEASWSNLGLGSILRLAQEYAANTMNAARNERLMRLLTEMDPIQQLRILEGARGIHGARGTAQTYFGLPPISSPAPLASWFASIREPQDRRPVMVPYRP